MLDLTSSNNAVTAQNTENSAVPNEIHDDGYNTVEVTESDSE